MIVLRPSALFSVDCALAWAGIKRSLTERARASKSWSSWYSMLNGLYLWVKLQPTGSYLRASFCRRESTRSGFHLLDGVNTALS